MSAIRLIKAGKPDKGDLYTLAKLKKSVELRDAAENVLAKIPHAEVGQRIQLPNFWTSVTLITILDQAGKPLGFEPSKATVGKVKSLQQECLEQDAPATAAAYRKLALRDLLIGGGSLSLGIIVTVMSFLNTEPGKSFAMMTGLIGVGLIEIGRGIYYFAKANRYANQSEELVEFDEE